MEHNDLTAFQPAPQTRGFAEFLKRNIGTFILLFAIVALAATQWPMLKGTFYRTFGTSAPDSPIPWRTDFAAALDESQKTGKPVLLDFTASWCPPCQVMKHEVWPDPQVAQLATDAYIPVLLDVDIDRNQPVAMRYNVTGIPTILITDSTGRVLREANFLSASDMRQFLTQK